MKYDLIVKRGRVVDAHTGLDGKYDVGIKSGKIAEVAPNLSPISAENVVDAEGYVVMPGVIDSHVHVSSQERWVGFAMMASKGVVTAVDFGGPIQSSLEGLKTHGCGMNLAGLHTVVPGEDRSDRTQNGWRTQTGFAGGHRADHRNRQSKGLLHSFSRWHDYDGKQHRRLPRSG